MSKVLIEPAAYETVHKAVAGLLNFSLSNVGARKS